MYAGALFIPPLWEWFVVLLYGKQEAVKIVVGIV